MLERGRGGGVEIGGGEVGGGGTNDRRNISISIIVMWLCWDSDLQPPLDLQSDVLPTALWSLAQCDKT